MRLTMLGTGHAMATRCYNTCWILEDQGERLLVDGGGGNGLLRQLQRVGTRWQDIHTIYVTHQHLDHITGIYWFIRCIGKAAMAHKDIGQFDLYAHAHLAHVIEETCTLLMPDEFRAAHDGHLVMHPVADGMTGEMMGHPVTWFDIGSTKMEQFGFRMVLTPGHNLVCCGDEPLPASCYSYGEGADWMLHEAFCLAAEEPQYKAYAKHHSTVRDACTLAERLHVRNLILYHTEDDHLVDRCHLYTAEGLQVYHGSLYVPEDLETIEV